MNVLYVEDDPRDADLVSRELTRSAARIQLEIAPTLQAARNRLADPNASYDLVLADVRLPDGTGLELLEEIRKQAQALAVVILTGVGDEETAVAALKAGADDYVMKRSDYLARLPLILETALERFKATTARRSRSLQVLYAEHDSIDIDLTRRHLARYAPHIHLDVAYTALEALQRLRASKEGGAPYDVLLLDYQLPGVNALELLKMLQHEPDVNLPTVLVTGRGDEEVAVEALRLGAVNYLVKNPGYLFNLPATLENAFYGTELERERARLAESERRFRLLAENARDLIYRYRFKPTPAFEYVSPAATRILGYTPEEHYADPELGFKVVHPDDRHLLAQAASAGYTGQPLVLRWIRKDGAIIWTEQHNTPIYNEQGELVALEGIARDITQRQQAIEALRASEAAERESRQLAEAFRDSAAALIGAPDLDTVMQVILESVARVVPNSAVNIMLIEDGYARPRYWRGYQPERIPHIQQFSVSVMDTPNLRQMVETQAPFLISHTDQYTDWVQIPLTAWVKSYVAAPIRSRGQVIGFLNLDSDVPGFFTEFHARHLQAFADQASLAIERAQLYEEIQRHARELERRVAERTADLQRSEARYRAIIESQTDLVCRFLPGGILTFVNQTFCQHFQRKPEALLGTSLFDLLPAEEGARLEHLIASLDRQNPIATIELREVTADGQERWFHWSEHMLFDEAGNFLEYQAVGRDITERKLAEEQLRHMLEQAISLGELKSRYASMAAHDLRSPLAAIKTSVDLLQRYSDRLTEEQKRLKYENIHSSIAVMIELLDDILTMGRVESGKLKFEPVALDLTAFCQDVVQEVRQAVDPERPIEFRCQDCNTARLDPKLLRHILHNLLSNAMKYSPAGTPVLFTVECRADSIVLRVQDHGIGIPEAEQAHLFETFFRASNARGVAGTGLGLAIVRQAVELHGGEITCESREGVGTTFTVTLPCVNAGDC